MSAKVFIDGEAGTTGLQIVERLQGRRDLTLVSIDPTKRKDADERRKMLNSADAVILCLPDDAAKEAVSLIENDAVKVIDASTAYRVAPDWTYGFAEMSKDQRGKIAASKRVSNPGCYPTGFIALVRPLLDAGVVPRGWQFSANAVSGYSGGGKAMIAEFDEGTAAPFFLYGLALEHKHVPELQRYSGLSTRPIFVPSVGNFAQGMLVSIPLHLDALPGKPKPADLEAALAARYAKSGWVRVMPADPAARLEPEPLNGSNMLELRVYGNAKHGQAVLVARLDNLGKGASGAAVQNLGLMLGVDVSEALPLAA